MTEPTWTTTPKPVEQTEYTHKAILEGLAAEIDERTGYTAWGVTGFLGEFDVRAFGHIWKEGQVDEAKALAIRAAARLREAGVTPTKKGA